MRTRTSKHFLLIGGYSHRNPGDEAILKSTVYSLNDLHPGSRFTIWSLHPDIDIHFDRDIRHDLVVWKPFPLFLGSSFLTKALIKLYVHLFPWSKRLASAFSRPHPDFLRAVRECDKAVFIGGGYINSRYSVIEMNYLSSLIQRQGKSMVLLGQTLGPFQRRQHYQMAEEIFRNAENIVLRDVFSMKEVEKHRDKVHCGIDDAIAFEPRLTSANRSKIDRFCGTEKPADAVYLGFNLLDWTREPEGYYGEVAKALASFAASLKDRKLKVFFIPMETSEYCDDRAEGRRFQAFAAGAKYDYVLVDEDLSVEEKRHILSRMDLFVGMRLHALAFSLASGVPTVGIYHNEYYFRKICGLLRSFGLNDNALWVERTEKLPGLIDKTFKNREEYSSLILEKKRIMVEAQRGIHRQVIDGEPLTLSAVIPTMNRSQDLKAAVDSLRLQTRPPEELVIVDQSTDGATRELVRRYESEGAPFKIVYLYQEEKSLVKARNRGLAAASGNLISYLDDDVVLFEDYFQKLLPYFEKDLRLGGISGNVVIRQPLKGLKWAARKLLMRIFLINSFDGKMTPSGFGYPIYERDILKAQPVEMLPGCDMTFRKKAVGEERFDEWFSGYGYREDVDFSYRVSLRAPMLIVPDARLYHNHSPGNRLDLETLKRMQMRNYYYVFKKYKGQNWMSHLLFLYSLVGLVAIDLIEYLSGFEPKKLSKLRAGLESLFILKPRVREMSERAAQ